jgi:hypothetical protein
MAKLKRPSARARRGARPRRASNNRLLITFGIIALIPFSLPTVMVLFCGLLPTLAAAVGERGGSRYAWLCIGGLNFAGLAPWLFQLWFGHHTIDYALNEITSLRLYLSAYGAAAAGSLLYLAMPPVVTAIMTANSKRRAMAHAVKQRKLVEEWGDEVGTSEETAEA